MKITLRGHHLEALAETYCKREGFFEIVDGKSPAELRYDKMMENYKRDFGVEKYNQMKKEFDSKPSLMGEEYDRKRAEKKRITNELEKQWLEDQDLQVTVSYGPDSLCGACPCVSDCSGGTHNEKDNEQDRKALRAYGFQEQETLTMKDIISRFRKYMQQNQFPSQRTKDGFGKSEWDTVVRKNTIAA